MTLQQTLSRKYENCDWIYQQLTTSDFDLSDSIKDLANTSWTIYSCTPIFNFGTLNKFENNLKHEIVKSGYKEILISATEVPLLAYFENDDPAIQLKISTSINQKRSNHFNGIFISRESNWKKKKDYLNLPIILCTGQNRLINTVISSLQRVYDVSVSPVKFSVMELLSLGLITCLNGLKYKNDTGDDDYTIKLKYCFTGDNSSSINYAIKLNDLNNFWRSTCDAIDLDSGRAILETFYRDLLTHFYSIYCIDISSFTLKSVIVDDCAFSADGRVKSQVPETFDFILKYLTQRFNFEKSYF